MKFIKTLSLLSLLPSAISAQTGSLTGVVKDSATSLPVIGAEVRLSKLGQIAKTDNAGRFTIALPAASASDLKDALTVREGRYWTKRIEFQWPVQSELDVKLQAAKQRLIVTTDIGGSDPDDEQSMVHLLVSADEYDIQGLICGLAWLNRKIGTNVLNSIVDDYGKVFSNLRVHSDDYPTIGYLKSLIKPGQAKSRMAGVGEGKDSPGSDWIISVVDQDDPRPVWINAWGGMNTMAQSLWKVKSTRSPNEVEKFVGKVRVYDILGQDDAGAWMAKTFPDLFYIRAKSVYGWAPSDDWVKTRIQSKGPLGGAYPNRIWAIEGDSPAFMHQYPIGLNDPDVIDQGGWGGRFSWTKKRDIRAMDIARKSGVDESTYDPYEMYSNTEDGVEAIKRWRTAIYNDFEARMDWSVTNKYAGANHHPTAVVNGDATRQVLEITASPGSTVTMDAAGSGDPDQNLLFYCWSFYQEPSSYPKPVKLENSSSPSAKVLIPADAAGQSIHIILELHDNGTPNLYAYRRVIINAR